MSAGHGHAEVTGDLFHIVTTESVHFQRHARLHRQGRQNSLHLPDFIAEERMLLRRTMILRHAPEGGVIRSLPQVLPIAPAIVESKIANDAEKIGFEVGRLPEASGTNFRNAS